MFEIKHLKTLTALFETGSLRKAAELTFSSQSALSHQLKELERRIGAKVFIRNSVPIEFTQQGKLLLSLAEDILPKISECQQQLKLAEESNRTLNVAMACHGCFQWLIPVVEHFNQQAYSVKIEFVGEIFEPSHEQHISLLFTDNKQDDEFIYEKIGSFEVVAVMPLQHRLAKKNSLQPCDFKKEILLTYPVTEDQLDIFKLFLSPANCAPLATKQVSNSHKLLQMVAANMGIAAVPKWLVSSLAMQSLLAVRSLGQRGVYKTLYARYKKDCEYSSLIHTIIPQAIEAFAKLQV